MVQMLVRILPALRRARRAVCVMRWLMLSRVCRVCASQQEQPSVRLLKHIIRCYLRLSENARARDCLRQCFPEQLRDPSFVACLKEDVATRRWLTTLLAQLGQDTTPPPQ
jgi:hypothetical protein